MSALGEESLSAQSDWQAEGRRKRECVCLLQMFRDTHHLAGVTDCDLFFFLSPFSLDG